MMNILNLGNLNINTNCDECENSCALLYCQQCEQHMCDKCDVRIHNKGRRAQHSRLNIQDPSTKPDTLIINLLFESHWLEQIHAHVVGVNESCYIVYRGGDLSCLLNDVIPLSNIQRMIFVIPEQLSEQFFKEQWLKCYQKFKHKENNLFWSIKQKRPTMDITLVFTEVCEDNNAIKILCKKLDDHEVVCAQPTQQEVVCLRHKEKEVQHDSELILRNLIQDDSYSELSSGAQRTDSSSLRPLIESNSFTTSDRSSQKFHFAVHCVLEWELHTPTNSLLWCMKRNCQSGTIVYSTDQLSELFTQAKINQSTGQDMLHQCIEKTWVLKITRLFNDGCQHFYSLNIKNITYESLSWVILSIKRDLITPTERLVVPRVKECFGIKLGKQEWDTIINFLSSTKSSLKFRNSQGKLVTLPLLCVRQVRDPLINELMAGIYIADQVWTVEDEIGNIDVERLPEWTCFTNFLSEFFAKHNESDHKSRILTGGRYGCAQFIKLFGPSPLRQCSLGRLTLFVQWAVNKGIIKYNKTILVKNQQESYLDVQNTDSSVEVESKIKYIQQALIELLLDYQDGISLAQIPQFLQPKVHFEINFNELGFPKLKNFLESMKYIIQLDNYGKNNCVAKIIQAKIPPKVLQGSHLNNHKVDLQAKQQDPTRQYNVSSDRTHYYKNQLPFTPHTNKPNSPLVNILIKIQYILREHCYGISIINLYNQLSQAMNEWFRFQQFACPTFLHFLQHYAEQMIVIVCQKDEYWIYERDYRFKAPPLLNKETSKSMTTHSKEKQFEQILNVAFPNQLLFGDVSNTSWLEKQSTDQHHSRILPFRGPLPEDSNLDIRENLRFIEELLGDPSANDNSVTQQYEWSVSLNQQIGTISSINLGDKLMHSKAYSEDFDLNKALEDKERRHTITDRSVKRQ